MFTKLKILILFLSCTSLIHPIDESDTMKIITGDSLKSNYHTLGEKNPYVDPNYGYPEIFLRFDKKTEDTNKTVITNAIYDSVFASGSGVTSSSALGYRILLSLKKSETFESDYYGLSLFGMDEIPETDFVTIHGLTFNITLGNIIVDASSKYKYHINLNGISFSLVLTSTVGYINGFAFGGFYGLGATKLNGIGIGGLAVAADTLNGIGIGVGTCSGSQVNGILLGGIINSIERLNGISVASINAKANRINSGQYVNGLIIGLVNFIDVNGLSIGLFNSGNSWIQIGLVNKGNSAIQIGLLNFDENMKFNLPIIYVRL